MSVPLFVYGTLKGAEGRARHRLLRHARFLGRASTSGTMYDLGRYPGVFRDAPRGRVEGELYEVPAEKSEQSLRALDRYEGSEFVRRRVYVTLRDGSRRLAWAYLLRRRPGRGAQVVPTGRYTAKRGVA